MMWMVKVGTMWRRMMRMAEQQASRAASTKSPRAKARKDAAPVPPAERRQPTRGRITVCGENPWMGVQCAPRAPKRQPVGMVGTDAKARIRR